MMRILVSSSVPIDPELLRRVKEEFRRDTGEDLEIGVTVENVNPSDTNIIAGDGVAILRLDREMLPAPPEPIISPEIPYVKQKHSFPRPPKFLGKGRAGKGGGRYR